MVGTHSMVVAEGSGTYLRMVGVTLQLWIRVVGTQCVIMAEGG